MTTTTTTPNTSRTPTSAPPSYSKKQHLSKSNSHWLQWAVNLLQKFSASLPEAVRSSLIESLKADSTENEIKSRNDAVDRLKTVLLHDRSNLSPTLMEDMKADLLTVISKYVEVDQQTLDLYLQQETNRIALVANVAVTREQKAVGDDSAGLFEEAAENTAVATEAVTTTVEIADVADSGQATIAEPSGQPTP
jgi:cell division topological specificity factor